MSTFWVSAMALISLSMILGVVYELSNQEGKSNQPAWQPVRIDETQPQPRNEDEQG